MSWILVSYSALNSLSGYAEVSRECVLVLEVNSKTSNYSFLHRFYIPFLYFFGLLDIPFGVFNHKQANVFFKDAYAFENHCIQILKWRIMLEYIFAQIRWIFVFVGCRCWYSFCVDIDMFYLMRLSLFEIHMFPIIIISTRNFVRSLLALFMICKKVSLVVVVDGSVDLVDQTSVLIVELVDDAHENLRCPRNAISHHYKFVFFSFIVYNVVQDFESHIPIFLLFIVLHSPEDHFKTFLNEFFLFFNYVFFLFFFRNF